MDNIFVLEDQELKFENALDQTYFFIKRITTHVKQFC